MSSKGSAEGRRLRRLRAQRRRRARLRGPIPDHTYATPARAEAYSKAMRKRAERWTPKTPVLYISISSSAPQNVRDAITARVFALVNDVEIVTFSDIFASTEDYEDRWESFITGAAGLIVNVGPRWTVGEQAAKEIRDAIKNRLPIFAASSLRNDLFPLVDCRIVALENPDPRAYARIDFPKSVARDSETFRSTLAAMRAAAPDKEN